MVERTYAFLKSTNGKNKLHVVMWKPKNQIRAILQISHGMAEYIDRYDRFATFMAENGIFVIGNDHLGHGDSVADRDELGYFDTKEKSKTVVDDLYKVSTKIRARYPGIPFIIMGHSMGSFLARRYMMTYGNGVDAAIYMGTGSQPSPVLLGGKMAAGIVGLAKGEHYRSPLLQKLAFGANNKRVSPVRTENDWLSRDKDSVDAYNQDEYCGFTFTVNGFKVLCDIVSFIQKPANIEKLPKDVPVLMVSGLQDPVGGYGKFVKQIYDEYKKIGIKRIDLKLYKNDRHEILNELDYEQVHKDILEFVESVLE